MAASTRGCHDSHAIYVQHKEPGCAARGVSPGTETQPTLPSPMAFMPLGWLLPEGDAQRSSTSSNSASETRCPSWTICGSSAYDQGASQVKCDTSQKLTILSFIVYCSYSRRQVHASKLSCHGNVKFLTKYLDIHILS